MKKIIQQILIACMPIFILFMFYTQMEAANVAELHNELIHVVGIQEVTKDNSSYGTSLTVIPCAEPIMSVMSASSLFNASLEVIDEFSNDVARSTYKECCDVVYSYISEGKGSFYTSSYTSTMKSLFEYFRALSEFGKDSQITIIYKQNLEVSLQVLNIVAVTKTFVTISLLICALLGFVVWRVKRYD